METLLNCSLFGPSTFGEKTNIGINISLEEAYELIEITDLEEFLNHTHNRHWCINHDSSESSNTSKIIHSTSPWNILLSHQNTEKTGKFTFILAPWGTGKTLFLHHMWEEAHKNYNKPSRSKLPSNQIAKPIFFCANKVIKIQLKNKCSLLEAITIASSYEINLYNTNNPNTMTTREEIEKTIENILKTDKCLLFIDNIDLLTNSHLVYLLTSLLDNSILNINCNVILCGSGINFNSNNEEIFKKYSKSIFLYKLSPGRPFKLPLCAQTRQLFRQYPMIDINYENNSLWSCFERVYHSQRQKLYPTSVHSPLLNFFLAWYLSENPDFYVPYPAALGKPSLYLSLYELLEKMYDHCIRKKYDKLIQFINKDENTKKQSSKNNNNRDDDDVIQEEFICLHNHENIGNNKFDYQCGIGSCSYVDLKDSSKDDNFAFSSENISLLANFDINQIKRLCSFVGFLVHWYSPHALKHDDDNSNFHFDPSEYNYKPLNHSLLVEIQISHLLSIPGVASLFGFDTDEDQQQSFSNYSNMEESVSSVKTLSLHQRKQLLREIQFLLSDFYKIRTDGSFQPCHQAFEDFLASRYLNEPAYFTNLIAKGLKTKFEIEEMDYNISCSSSSNDNDNINENEKLDTITKNPEKTHLNFRVFQWHDDYFLTHWYWDSIYQFVGFQRGIDWLLSRLLHTSPLKRLTLHQFNTKTSQQQQQQKKSKPQQKQKPKIQIPKNTNRDRLQIQSNYRSTSLPIKEIQSGRRVISTSSNTRKIEKEFENLLFRKWIHGIQTKGIDDEDVGQVRFQLILRIHSLLCNHRPIEMSQRDVFTILLSDAFMSLMQKSSTVLAHLELFPNYFLSGFTVQVAKQITQKCIHVFQRRPTQHIIHLLSLFVPSDYLLPNLPQLAQLANNGSEELCYALLTIFRHIDRSAIERDAVPCTIQMLTKSSLYIGKPAFTHVVNMGFHAFEQIFTDVSIDRSSINNMNINSSYSSLSAVSSLASIPSLSNIRYSRSLPSPFLPFDPLTFIQSAVHHLIELITVNQQQSQSNPNHINSNLNSREAKSPMEYGDFLSIAIALLQERDDGSRYLGFLSLSTRGLTSTQNHYNKKNNGHVKNSVFCLTDALVQFGARRPTNSFSYALSNNNSAMNNNNNNNRKNDNDYNVQSMSFTHIELEVTRGRAHMSSLLNSEISNDLGVTASCWVSSVIEILMEKYDLLLNMNALLFTSLPFENIPKVLKFLIIDTPLTSDSWYLQREFFELMRIIPNSFWNSLPSEEFLVPLIDFICIRCLTLGSTLKDRIIILDVYRLIIQISPSLISFSFLHHVLFDEFDSSLVQPIGNILEKYLDFFITSPIKDHHHHQNHNNQSDILNSSDPLIDININPNLNFVQSDRSKEYLTKLITFRDAIEVLAFLEDSLNKQDWMSRICCLLMNILSQVPSDFIKKIKDQGKLQFKNLLLNSNITFRNCAIEFIYNHAELYQNEFSFLFHTLDKKSPTLNQEITKQRKNTGGEKDIKSFVETTNTSNLIIENSNENLIQDFVGSFMYRGSVINLLIRLANSDKIGKKLIDICGKLLPYRDGGSFSLSSKMQWEGFLRMFANVSYDQISPEILQRIVSLLLPSRNSPNYIIISVLDFCRNHIDVLSLKIDNSFTSSSTATTTTTTNKTNPNERIKDTSITNINSENNNLQFNNVLELIVFHLSNSNLEIKSAAENALLCNRDKNENLFSDNDEFFNFAISKIKSLSKSDNYNDYFVVIILFRLVGEKAFVKCIAIANKLLLSKHAGIALEMINCIRYYLYNKKQIFLKVWLNFDKLLQFTPISSPSVLPGNANANSNVSPIQCSPANFDSSIRIMIRKKLFSILAKQDVGKEFISIAQRTVRNSHECVRVKCKALNLLSNFGGMAEIIDSLIVLLQTNQESDLESLLFTLENSGPYIVNIIPQLLVSSYQAGTQKWILLTLLDSFRSHMNWEQQFPFIIKMCSDPDPIVIRKAISLVKRASFTCINDPNSLQCAAILDTLIKLNNDNNSLVRRDSTAVLGDIGKKFPSLIPQIIKKILTRQDNTNILVWQLLSYKWGVVVPIIANK